MQQPTAADTAGWSEVVVEVSLAPGHAGQGLWSLGGAAGAADLCMTTHRLQLLRRYMSRDGLKQIYVFLAPDAESVRRVVEAHCTGAAPLRLSVWPTRG